LNATAWPPVDEAILKLFDYDRNAPLDVQEHRVTPLTGYTHYDLSYASPKGGRVPAYLLVPDELTGPFAGIIIQHGMAGTKHNHLFFARSLVATGAVVLLIDAPYARPENRNRIPWPLTFTEVDRLDQIQLMIDLLRGVDLLTAREDVDPERLAYIGISYGAAMGGLFAGLETRLKAYGLMVGDGGLVAHYTTADGTFFADIQPLSADQQKAWLALMEPIEPIRFIGRAAPAALFFQNALHDELVTREDALAYQAAGSEPKRIEWYASNHGLPDQAYQDLVDWLETQIGIEASRFGD
jgi:dienelactone hydrolase